MVYTGVHFVNHRLHGMKPSPDKSRFPEAAGPVAAAPPAAEPVEPVEPVGTAFSSIMQFESPLRAMRISVFFNI